MASGGPGGSLRIAGSRPSLRSAVPCAECRCRQAAPPPLGAACCRPRDGDAWPAVTGPPAVAAGAANRRPPSASAPAGGTTRQRSPPPPPPWRRRYPVSNTASRNSDRHWYCTGTNQTERGRCRAWLERPFRAAPRRYWAGGCQPGLTARITGAAHRDSRPGHDPDSAGSRQTGPDPGTSRKKQEAISLIKHSR
jgi:hypothetical protein